MFLPVSPPLSFTHLSSALGSIHTNLLCFWNVFFCFYSPGHILLPAYEVFLSPFSLPVCPHLDTHIFPSKANFYSSFHPSMSQMKALPGNISDFNLPGNISQNLLPVYVNSTYYINFDSPLYLYLVLCIMVILNTYLCNNFSNVYCLFYTRPAMRVVILSILFIIVVLLHAAVPNI